jgi:glycosyltransferase involved in cell wall biosynthesis
MKSVYERTLMAEIDLKYPYASPLFSVIVPTFKRPDQLICTLESFHNSPFIGEVLVINDDSSSPISVKMNKVSVHNPAEKLGEAGAINFGWELAKLPYVIVISDDDPQTLELFDEIAKVILNQPGSLVYFPNSIERNSKAIIKTSKAREFSKVDFYGLLRCPCLAGVAINRNLLISLGIDSIRNSQINFPTDLIQWLELSMLGGFVPVKKGFAFWWRHEDQMTTNLGVFNSSIDYFANVTHWFRSNPSAMQQSTLWAVYFRSMQLQGRNLLTKQGFKIGFKNFVQTYITYRIEGRKRTQILVALCLVVIEFLKLKLNNEA